MRLDRACKVMQHVSGCLFKRVCWGWGAGGGDGIASYVWETVWCTDTHFEGRGWGPE